MLSALDRTRCHTIGRFIVLATLASALAVVGMTTVTATDAHALAGRRVCMYVEGDYNDGVWRFIVMNYKKSGRCPYVNQDKHPHLVYDDPNHVTKRTCEEVSDFIGHGDDLCRVLQADRLYELLFDERTMLPAERTLLGHVREFA